VILVVPIEELAAEAPGVSNALEPLRKPRLVFPGFEVAFGERVVVGRVRPIVRTGDAKIGQQKRGRFGLHWATTIGVQRELTSWHSMFGDCLLEQRPKQRGAFGICDAPANHPAAENIQDHVKKEIGPFRRPHQFGDVPRPDLVGHFGQQFRLLVDGMTQLPTPFANFAMLAQQPIHRADRAMIDAVIQQRGVDFRGGLIREARRVKQIQHHPLLRTGQRPGWPRPCATDWRWRDHSYPRAIRSTLGRDVRRRTNVYLNNRLEQDHRGIK
jgi:hypothetical protein